MLPTTLQFLLAMLTHAFNEQMARRVDYLQEEVCVLKELLGAETGRTRMIFTPDQRRLLALKGKALTPVARSCAVVAENPVCGLPVAGSTARQGLGDDEGGSHQRALVALGVRVPEQKAVGPAAPHHSKYPARIGSRWISPRMTTWSRHSRRSEPMSLSAAAFCHGDLAAVTTSSIPRTFSVCRTRSP
jgi:hypothetical protein